MVLAIPSALIAGVNVILSRLIHVNIKGHYSENSNPY